MAQILDQYGNPLKRDALADPQTSRIAALANTYIQSNTAGLTPAKAARYLRDADMGDILAQSILFDDMEDRDSHLKTEMAKRANALVGVDWDIVPPRDANAAEKNAAAWIKEVLQDYVNDWENLILALMGGVGHGFAPVELEWSRVGKDWLPAFQPRPQTWFRLSKDRRELRLADASAEGAELWQFGWVMHTHGLAKTGYIGRLGLMRALVWPFIYRSYAVGDFAEFLETYGLPIILGKYFAGATDDEKASLMRAVAALGHDARAIMPADMQIEIQSITGGAGGSHHMAMVEWAEKSETRAILGATLTSGADGKSSTNALGKVHDGVRHDIARADGRQIGATLTRDLVYPMIVLNRGGIDGMRRCPHVVFDTRELEDLKTYSEALPPLVNVGLQIPVSWAQNKLGVPSPVDGEAVLRPAAASPSPPTSPRAALVALTAKPVESAAPDQAVLDSGVDGLPADALQRMMETTLAPVVSLIQRSADYQTVYDALAAVYPAMDTSAVEQLVARCYFVAEIWGRLSVQAEGDA